MEILKRNIAIVCGGDSSEHDYRYVQHRVCTRSSIKNVITCMWST